MSTPSERCAEAEAAWNGSRNFIGAAEFGATQCPCGSAPLAVRHTTGRFRIFCERGGHLDTMHRGAARDTLAEAVAAWNARDHVPDVAWRGMSVEHAA